MNFLSCCVMHHELIFICLLLCFVIDAELINYSQPICRACCAGEAKKVQKLCCTPAQPLNSIKSKKNLHENLSNQRFAAHDFNFSLSTAPENCQRISTNDGI